MNGYSEQFCGMLNIQTGEDVPRFVTAYPQKEQGDD
jgi:hypothetical protein